MPRRIAAVLALVIAASTLRTGAFAAPTAPLSYGAAIEAYSPYQPQSTCSPTAKPGVVAFRDQVVRTYAWTRSLGIVRACTVGGRSEHKEGRAWDWGVSAYSTRDVGAVNDLMRWLFATDRYGNTHAMARRLGIQYVIWNRRIWSSSNASAGWRAYTGASPHTDHVHFSFGWPGANRATSYWTGRVAGSTSAPSAPDTVHVMPDDTAVGEPQPPATLLAGPPLEDERIFLDARRPGGSTTLGALQAGAKYYVEVSGHFGHRAGARADAECSTAPGSSTWSRSRSLDPRRPDADHLDVYLNGIDLVGRGDGDADCDTATHMYRWLYVPERTGRANFRVWDTTFADNSGGLSVRVFRLLADDTDYAFWMSATAPAGTTGRVLFREDVEYVVEVRGTYAFGGGTADAECSVASPTWARERAGGTDWLDVLMHGRDPRGEPLVDTGGDCDERTHTYRWVWRPRRDMPASLKVFDTRHSDNAGLLHVRVLRRDLAASRLAPAPPA